MKIIIYNTFLYLYKAAIAIASLFNHKAKLWIDGRKNLFKKLTLAFDQNSHPVIWVHCASLGEFEQGRPLIEQLKQIYPSYKILLTFFSPSGYEIRKNYNKADWVFYLPLDTPTNVKRFVQTVNPSLAVFVKYEYWYHYLRILHQKQIPTILISAIFRKNSIFSKWYGGLHREMLRYFSHLFVQNIDSYNRIKHIVSDAKITLAGDTRFDRVYEIAHSFEPLPIIEGFVRDKKTIVAGSTWPEDEAHLKKLKDELENDVLLIIAPHEVTDSHIQFLKSTFPKSILYSELNNNTQLVASILIIDNVGMLSKLYYYGTLCYIGGGFNKSGIHNSLEAAVYGKPVIFGPNYHKFAEAIGLIECKGAFSYKDEHELITTINSLLKYETQLMAYSSAAKKYVEDNIGATDKIMTWIRKIFS